MRLNHNFILHKMDDMTLVVPVSSADFHGIVQGNKSVAVILECLQHNTTEEEIVNVMCEKFDGSRSVIKKDVADVISRLKEIGAIDE